MALNFNNDDALFDFMVRKGHGVKGLVDSGISHVPDRFVQPLSERIDDLPAAGVIPKQPAPPIDLSKLDGPEHDQVVDAIVKAAETVGFLQVVNHGVPSKLLDSIIASAHGFFDQSTQVKAAYLQGVSPSPLVFYCSGFASDKEKVMEWRDFLSLLYTNDAEALQHWPGVCREEAIEYLNSTMEMMRKIFKILIENLKVSLDSTRMESLFGTKRLNMNYYPSCPNPELTVGVRRHSDMNMLTLLLQDGIGGLQMKVKKDDINDDSDEKMEEWIEIPPFPDSLIINIGDALQILSNGHYISAEHRTRTSNKKSRVSIPVLISPLFTENIGPFPELVKLDGAARYREILYSDYKAIFFGNPVVGKKSLDFVKTNPSA